MEREKKQVGDGMRTTEKLSCSSWIPADVQRGVRTTTGRKLFMARRHVGKDIILISVKTSSPTLTSISVLITFYFLFMSKKGCSAVSLKPPPTGLKW